MNSVNIIEKIRERQKELSTRLHEAMQRAVESKAQYEELEKLLSDPALDKEVAEQIRTMRQSKLAENNLAVNDVQDLQARLKIHEELLNALEAKQDGA